MGSLVFLALLLGVMYFILIRPQQRQMKEQQARIRSLEAGMIVVTNSGIHGAIAEVEDKVIWLEVCLLYTSPSPRDYAASRMPSSA